MIYNIFKNKKQNSEKKENSEKLVKPKIVADIHEKDSLIFAELTRLGAEIHIMPLEVGDFLIAETIIERKTASDFISSMLSKRLMEQLNNMKQYSKALLIIENYEELNNPKGSLNPNAIKGMVLSITNDWNIPIIFTKDSEETASYLFLLAKRQLKPQSELTLHSRKPETKSQQIQYIIESFPSIGPKTAKALLKKFRTIRNIINAKKEELEEILKGKAEDFMKLLD